MRWAWAAVCGWMLIAGRASAIDIYVDNQTGREANDGRAEQPLGANAGPVLTIRRALELVSDGDTIHLANTGDPYYESFSLVGSRMGGIENVPLTILGHGATLSGLRQLPRQAWRSEGDNLWSVRFNRKGFYFLLRDGKPLREFRVEGASDPRGELPAGQWCAIRGAVFLRQDGLDEPGAERFDYAADEMGVTLYHVRHVRIADLTIEHFRVDGVNAYDSCSDVVLENVTCRENGRSGIAVGGTSSVTLRGGTLAGNGRESALITGKGRLSVEETRLDVPPTVRP